ncbi:MAG: CreA family protein [Proteobacteria bacterium]|nr:CreA family protein [Pseudomonadota bacterium]
MSRRRPAAVSAVLLTALLAPLALSTAAPARADEPARIGAVSTTFRVIGRNDRIVVERYDDPKVKGVSCYVSRAETGGVKGTLGLATDPNRFSIACRAVGPVTAPDTLPDNETVWSASASPLFKEIRVSRLFDKDKRVLVYVVWSTITLSTGGSAFNSVTAVPLDAH